MYLLHPVKVINHSRVYLSIFSNSLLSANYSYPHYKPFKGSYLRLVAELSNPHDLMSAITSFICRKSAASESIAFLYSTSIDRSQVPGFATKLFKKLYHRNRKELSIIHEFIFHYFTIH